MKRWNIYSGTVTRYYRSHDRFSFPPLSFSILALEKLDKLLGRESWPAFLSFFSIDWLIYIHRVCASIMQQCWKVRKRKGEKVYGWWFFYWYRWWPIPNTRGSYFIRVSQPLHYREIFAIILICTPTEYVPAACPSICWFVAVPFINVSS